jgi:L-fuconolactonase
MPYGNNDWLSLSEEPTLEPKLPICDPHHHFWDFRKARMPYERYLLHELVADIDSGHNIQSTVFIEAGSMYRSDGPSELRSVGEIEFVQGLAAASASGMYGEARAAASIVGRANLSLGNDVRPVLEQLSLASPNRFRGIRHSVTWDPHPEIEKILARGRAKENQLGDKKFRAGASVLADMGLSLEAWLFFPQLKELADFAKSVPDLNIILNHVGGLLRVGPYANRDSEVISEWKSGIKAVSECPNINIKLGGLGMPQTGFGWESRETPVNSVELAADMEPFLDYCIEQFGPDRSMFESNFPVDKVSYSYNVLYNAFKIISRKYTFSERAKLFHDTAVRIYKIEN